jgi:hypothetical protein
MRLAGVLGLLLSACSFEHGQIMGDGSVVDLDASDARIDGPAGCTSFSTQIDTCSQLMPGSALQLDGSNTFDTDDFSLTTPNGNVDLPHTIVTTPDGDLVVVFVTTFDLLSGATLRVVGNSNDRPLGIVATGAVTISGLIDLSDNGAGARDDSACGAALVGDAGQTDAGGGSGGGGGAFAGSGGGGGNGDKDMNADGGQSTGAAGGIALLARPMHVLGGCDGGHGGDSGGSGGNAGDGGGAIFIASAAAITIATSGGINAGGGGGRGGTGNGGGGGGGGSGGMILLESNSVTINGKLGANGGGGGEGADGNDGADGTIGLLSTSRASGGSGNAGEGGDGAAGGANTNADGQSATQLKNGGGGGGGGGVGFIAIGSTTPITTGAIISPPYQAWP